MPTKCGYNDNSIHHHTFTSTNATLNTARRPTCINHYCGTVVTCCKLASLPIHTWPYLANQRTFYVYITKARDLLYRPTAVRVSLVRCIITQCVFISHSATPPRDWQCQVFISHAHTYTSMYRPIPMLAYRHVTRPFEQCRHRRHLVSTTCSQSFRSHATTASRSGSDYDT